MGDWKITGNRWGALPPVRPSVRASQKQTDDCFQGHVVYFAQHSKPQAKKFGIRQAWKNFWSPPFNPQVREFNKSLFLLPLAVHGFIKTAEASPTQAPEHIRIQADKIRATVKVHQNRITSILKLPFPVKLQERQLSPQDLNNPESTQPLIQVLSLVERFPYLGQSREFFSHALNAVTVKDNIVSLEIPGLIAKDALIRIQEGVLKTQDNKPIPYQDVNTPAVIEENSQGFVDPASAQVAFERPYLPFFPTEPTFINIEPFEKRAYATASEGVIPISRPEDVHILNQIKALTRFKTLLQDDRDALLKFLDNSVAYSPDVNIRAALIALGGTPFFDVISQEVMTRYQEIDFKPLPLGQLSLLERDPASGKYRLSLNQDFKNEHFEYLAALLVQELVKYSQTTPEKANVLTQEKALVAEAFATMAYGSELLSQINHELNLDLPLRTTPLAKRFNTRLYAFIQSGGYYSHTLDLGFPNPGLQKAPHLKKSTTGDSVFPYPDADQQTKYQSWQEYIKASPENENLPLESDRDASQEISPLSQALADVLVKQPMPLHKPTFKALLKSLDQSQSGISNQKVLYLVELLRLHPSNPFYPRVSLG